MPHRLASLPLEAIAGRESPPAELAAANDLLEQLLLQLDDLDQQLVHLKLAGHSSVESAAMLVASPPSFACAGRV